MSGVVPGVFTAVQTNKPELRRYFFLLTEAVSYLALPATLGLAVTADDFVLLALGDTWSGVIVPLRLLCLYMAIYSSQALLSHVLLWTGHFSTNMWLNILALAILPVCFYIGATYGLIGVAVGWLIGFPLSDLPAFVYVNRILASSWTDYWRTFRPALTGCVVMLGVVALVRLVLPEEWHHGLRLAVQSSAGALIYAGVMFLMFGNRVREMYRVVLGTGQQELGKNDNVTEDPPAALDPHS
jgi:PST family polysaccharide transporter